MKEILLCVGAAIVFVGAVAFLSWVTRPPRVSEGDVPQQADVTCDAVAWSCGLGGFCGVLTTGAHTCVKTSPDGIFWTLCDTPGDKNVRWTSVSVVELNTAPLDAFLITNDENRATLVSTDGINWTLYCD